MFVRALLQLMSVLALAWYVMHYTHHSGGEFRRIQAESDRLKLYMKMCEVSNKRDAPKLSHVREAGLGLERQFGDFR